MATDYARLRLSVEVSTSSDYSDPYVHPKIPSYTFRPDEAAFGGRINIATAGTTLDTTSLDLTDAAAATLVVVNLDTANYVAVEYEDIGSTVTVTNRVPAGGILVVPMLNPTTVTGRNVVLTANTAAVTCYVYVIQA